MLRRISFSSSHPVDGAPFENKAPMTGGRVYRRQESDPDFDLI
jgi:hypothetical protein